MDKKPLIIQHRRGTKAALDFRGVVPKDGEVIIEKEDKIRRAKIGDGRTPYSELSYITDEAEQRERLRAEAVEASLDNKLTAELSSMQQTVLADRERAITAEKDLQSKIDNLNRTMNFIGAGPLSNRPQIANNGDVYMDTDTSTEYIWTDGEWVILGDSTSYALKTIKLGGYNGIVGGGDLSNNLSFGLNDTFYNYLVKQTFKYPSISTFTLGVTGAFEVNTTQNIIIKHQETNLDNIVGTLTLTRDSTVINTEIAPTSSLTEIYDEEITSDSPKTITYSLGGIHGLGASFSAKSSISFYLPSFIGAASEASINSVEGFTRLASQTIRGEKTIETTEESYVYFVTTGIINKITSAGFDVPFVTLNTLNIKINSTEKSYTYNVYRTANKLIPGRLTYIIS